MDDRNPFAYRVVPGDPEAQRERVSPSAEPAAESPAEAPSDAGVSEAVVKFRSCRWRSDPEAGEFCTHRDVLPFAGKEGFVPESWCPDCQFFKLRRSPRKRDPLY